MIGISRRVYNTKEHNTHRTNYNSIRAKSENSKRKYDENYAHYLWELNEQLSKSQKAVRQI